MNNSRDIDESAERALDVMEHRDSLTDADLTSLQQDASCLRDCQTLTEATRAMMADMPSIVPDVDAEWKKFEQRHEQPVHNCASHKSYTFSALMGAAAMLALVLLVGGGYWLYHSGDAQPVTVFVADKQSQNVILQTGDGELIVVDDEQSGEKLRTVGAQLQSKSLAYTEDGAVGTGAVKTHTLSTPRGTDFHIVLADGSQVWLNAESRLEYPSAFHGKNRVVSLYGEAYFKVAKDAAHPFIVQMGDVQTQVLGTEFNVRNYTVTDSHVTLISGSVEVYNTKKGSVVRLSPGEDARLQPDGEFALTHVDVDSYIYWKDGYFYFDNVSLVDIMQNLGRWYNVTIRFDNREAMNYRMHFMAIRKDGLENTIDLLNKMKKVSISMEDSILVVR